MSKKTTVLILFIFIISIILRIVFRGVLFWGIPFDYATIAHQIAIGNFWQQPIDTANFRFLITFPTALSFRLFGANEYSIIIWPLILYSIEFFLLIKIVRLILPKIHPVIPAVLLAFYPLDIAMSSSPYLDIALSTLFCAAFYIFLIGLKNKNNLLIFLTGVLVMLGQYLKEYAPIFILFLLGYLFYEKIHLEKRRFIQIIAVLLSGALLIFLSEMLLSHYFTGQWFYRYAFLKDAIRPRLALEVLRGYVDPSAYNLRHYFFIMFFQPEVTGIYFYLLSGGVVLAYLNQNTKAKELWWWFLIVFLFLEFAFLRLHPYVTVAKEARYLSAITLPVILLCAYFIDEVFLQSRIKSKKILVATVLIGLSILSCAGCLDESMKPQSSPEAQAAKYLTLQPEFPVVVSSWWMQDTYNFYFNYRKNVLSYNDKGSIKQYYVIVDKNFFKIIPNPIYWPPDGNPPTEIVNPPASWQKLASFSEKGFPDKIIIYSVNKESDDNVE